jgi:hypothetical protein
MDGYYRRKKIIVLPVGWNQGCGWTKELAKWASAQGTKCKQAGLNITACDHKQSISVNVSQGENYCAPCRMESGLWLD